MFHSNCGTPVDPNVVSWCFEGKPAPDKIGWYAAHCRTLEIGGQAVRYWDGNRFDVEDVNIFAGPFQDEASVLEWVDGNNLNFSFW